ncbi:aspartate carbamoyltransferase [Candidatus Saccharibacteria bacterium]|nr:aspartate carbamoyltransferase [Candidatus Saccharibacteria bacterium]
MTRKTPKNIISTDQFSRESLEDLFLLTDDIIANPAKYAKMLDGKIVSTLFYEPSTRTRLSFESAACRLGASVISTENAREVSSAVKGETLQDTIRVVNGYADAIVMRHSDVDSAEIAASVSSVPILNAGAGSGEHPTQALLDMYTIRQKKGDFNGLKVAISGDLLKGRTVHSLVKLLSLYDSVTIYGLSHKLLKLPQSYVDFMKEHDTKYIPCSEFTDLPADLDIIYHTRTQLERLESGAEKIKEYIIDKKVMSQFSPETYLLHPLPRIKEIAPEGDDDPRAIYFEQAHNGVKIRMALLAQVLTR